MSKRTELKLKKINKVLKDKIFSRKYIVRNIFSLLVVVTLAVIATVSFTEDNAKSVDKVEPVTEVASVDTYYETQDVSITAKVYDVKFVDATTVEPETIEVLKAELNEPALDKVAVDVNQVAEVNTNALEGKAVSNINNLNIRSSENSTSSIVGRMMEYAVAEIIDSGKEWTYIKSGNIKGYVKNDYILTGDSAERAYNKCVKKIGTVNTDGITIRKKASSSSEAIAVASKNDKFVVDLKYTSSEWTCVKAYDGSYGYIASEYIKVSEGYEHAVSIDKINAMKTPNKMPMETADSVTVPTEAVTTEATTSTGNLSGSLPTVNRGNFNLSDEDINLLACIVYAEANNQCYEGKLALANVVLNRLVSGKWGNTITDVLYAKNQFTAVNNHWFRDAMNGAVTESCIKAAKEAASGVNNIGTYLSYRTLAVAKYDTYDSYVIIGNHCFF